MNWLLSSSIQLVISDLNEIAADAYRHRIRPTNRRGGSGAYDGSNGGRPFALPPKYQNNPRAQFVLTHVSADTIEIQAVSLHDKSLSIHAVIDQRGRLQNIVHPAGERGMTIAPPLAFQEHFQKERR